MTNKHLPDEREQLEREKVLHQQLIDSRREKQRKHLLKQLQERQQDRLRNILK